MNSDKDKGRTSKPGGANVSATPSIALLNRRLGIAPTPRMLTRYEIDLLRRSLKEIAKITREILAGKVRASLKHV